MTFRFITALLNCRSSLRHVAVNLVRPQTVHVRPQHPYWLIYWKFSHSETGNTTTLLRNALANNMLSYSHNTATQLILDFNETAMKHACLQFFVYLQLLAKTHFIILHIRQLEPPSHVIIQETNTTTCFSVKTMTESVRRFYPQSLLQKQMGPSLSQKLKVASPYPSLMYPHITMVCTGAQGMEKDTELDSKK